MIRGLILCIILFSFSGLQGQNPFDIKKPVPGKSKSTVKKEVKRPETKAPSIKSTADSPVSTVKSTPQKTEEGSSLIDMLELDKKTSSKESAVKEVVPKGAASASTNIFDIKTPKGKVVKPTIIQVPGSRAGTAANKPKPSSGTSEEPALEIKTIEPSANSAGPASDSGSFIELIPPSEQTDIKDIKKELKLFGNASTSNRGEISKNAWFIIYIFLFLLAAIAINFNRSYPALLLKATYNQNQLRILFKDAFKGNHMLIFGILYFLFIINAGIFIYQSFRLFQVSALSLFWSILIVVFVYLTRHLVLYILGKVFPMEKEAMFFNYTIGIHNLTAGLGLMLINILLSFIDPETGKMLIFSGLGIIIALYAMRQVRGLLNNIPVIVSRKLHFIIYLCAVEIAPWMILVRYLTT